MGKLYYFQYELKTRTRREKEFVVLSANKRVLEERLDEIAEDPDTVLIHDIKERRGNFAEIQATNIRLVGIESL